MSAEYVTPTATPHVIRPGVATTVRHTVLLRDTEAAPGSISSVTVQLSKDGVAKGAAVTAALDGAGPAYVATIPGATTAGEDVTPGWLAVWAYTIAGVAVPFRRLVRLVVAEVYPTVTSTELLADYPDLGGSLIAGAADLRGDLATAWEELDRDLAEHGVDLHRIMDPRTLARAHKLRAAALRYAKVGASTQDPDLQMRASQLRDEYDEHLRRTILYDQDGDGATDSKQRMTSADGWDVVQRRHG